MTEQNDKDISRRAFLSSTSAAAFIGSMNLAGAVPAGARLDSDQKIRIGVVGGGFGASFHWHLDPNCTVEAVSDLRVDRRNRLQQVYKCEKAYESLEKLVLDPKIEAVAVFTGAPDHVRHCVDVMNHGKHCICAVPAAMSLEEAALLKETKERTGLKYMMAETSYYRRSCILARQLYQDGMFGKFVYCECEYYHYLAGKHGQAYWWQNGKPTWRHGYAPMLYPTHSTAYHVGVTRERITDISCLGWGDDHPDLQENQYDNPFWNMTALGKCSGGNICRCNVMYNVVAGGERAQWLGEKLSLYMPGSGGQPFAVKAHGSPPVTALPDYQQLLPESMRVASGHGGSHTFLTHEFVAALVEDREPAIDVYESLAMTVPGIVAQESAKKGGQQLKVPSFDK